MACPRILCYVPWPVNSLEEACIMDAEHRRLEETRSKAAANTDVAPARPTRRR